MVFTIYGHGGHLGKGVASDVQAQFAIFHVLGAKMLPCQHFFEVADCKIHQNKDL